MKTLACPGVKSVQSIFCDALSIALEKLFTSSTPQGESDRIAESAYRAETLGTGRGFSIILLKDTTAVRKLTVILDLISCLLARGWCCKSLPLCLLSFCI